MPYVPIDPGTAGGGFFEAETDREWYGRLILFAILFSAVMVGGLAYHRAWQAAIALAFIATLVVLFLRRCIKKEEMMEAELEHALVLPEKRP